MTAAFSPVCAQPASTAGRSAQRVVRRARMSNITRQPPPRWPRPDGLGAVKERISLSVGYRRMLRRPGASWPNGAFASGSGHPASAAGCRGPTARQGRDLSSEFDLFRDAERVLDLDPEIADRAFQLRVAEQKLNRSQVPSLLIDLRRLRPPHRMRPVGGAVEPNTGDPSMDDSRILPCR